VGHCLLTATEPLLRTVCGSEFQKRCHVPGLTRPVLLRQTVHPQSNFKLQRFCTHATCNSARLAMDTHTHTHPFNGPLSGTTQVSLYQKGKSNLDFIGARDSEWQWHQLGHMQVCTSLQRDNHASTPLLSFYRPDALPAAQPTASKH